MLIDPESLAFTSIGGFSVVRDYGRGHDEGVTSADAVGNKLIAIDRTLRKLCFVDPESKTIFRTLPLKGALDYVRFVEATGEAWVTEPKDHRLEIFPLLGDSTVERAESALLAIPEGVRGLSSSTTPTTAPTPTSGRVRL